MPTEPNTGHRPSGSLNLFLLSLFDGLAVSVVGFATVVYLHDGLFPQRYIILFLLLFGGMAFFYDLFGIYQTPRSFTQSILSLVKAWIFTFGFLLALGFVTKETEAYSRLAVGILFTGGLAAQILVHILFRVSREWLKTAEKTAPALIIGTGELANQIHNRVHDNPWIMESVVGAVTTPRPCADDGTEEPANENPIGPKVLGTIDDTIDLVRKHGIRTIYLAVPLDASPAIEPLYFRLLDENVNVHWVPNIFSLPLINHSIRELNGLPVITLSETPLVGLNRVMKEIEDKVLASILLVLASPIMILTAIAIKLDSPGPVFFRQPRTGWDGKVFHIWKFRSMRTDQPKDDKVEQATRNDPRVTRVGRFIRRTSIDELPQLFNVLAGDMSLVGPRPHAVQHNEEYAGKISAYLARHRIKPGITGLAQVKGYRGETRDLELMAKRVHFDIEYINNWSIGLDLAILARTVIALFRHEAY
ncbi:MAG TPA: undecaprenyl-phosphate glucose phosphotransferase [Chromatiales bacterium]|nr:undecaprenyl-phosphate glucose phosphotransferase [Chromatiales bacterium]